MRATFPRASLLCSGLWLALGTGCAGSRGQLLADVRTNLGSANYTLAYQAYARTAKTSDDVDKLLNLGLLAFESGDYAEAHRAFARADAVAEERLTKSVTQEAMAIVLTDRMRPYPGGAFERAMLHYYRALAFLAADSLSPAVVEGRAIAHQLAVTARESKHTYRDDAFLQWFSGSLYQSFGQENDAWISYRRARELYGAYYGVPEPAFLCRAAWAAGRAAGVSDGDPDLVRACPDRDRTPQPGWGRVIVLCEAGQAPPILENNIVFPFLKNDRHDGQGDEDYLTCARSLYGRGAAFTYDEANLEYLLRVALPYYAPEYRGTRVTAVKIREAAGPVRPAELVQDVSAILRQDLADRQPSIIVRAIARALIKYAATKAAEKKTEKKDGLAHDVLPWLVNAVGVATEGADTRSWETLPDRIYAADFSVPPGEHSLSATFSDGTQGTLLQIDFPPVQVGKDEVVFLRARCAD